MDGFADIMDEGHSEKSKQEFLQNREASWEETAVRKVLKILNLPISSLLVRKSMSTTGRRTLRFSQFFDRYPAFPCRLVARRVPYLHKTSLEDLRKKFTKTRIYRSWRDSFDMEQPDRGFGVVMPWARFQTTVVHNMALRTFNRLDVDGAGFIMIEVTNSGCLVIEELSRFIKGMASEWMKD